jgi:lactate dehydrogenase-like 2-hydroxyacid dehydrogenase
MWSALADGPKIGEGVDARLECLDELTARSDDPGDIREPVTRARRARVVVSGQPSFAATALMKLPDLHLVSLRPTSLDDVDLEAAAVHKVACVTCPCVR